MSFSSQELNILYEVLVENYEKWKNSLKKERACKGGLTPQQQLCQTIAEQLSSLANGQPRTRNQIRDRIKFELRKIRNWISNERQNLIATGGGKRRKVPAPPVQLEMLVEQIRGETASTGIGGIAETYEQKGLVPQADQNNNELYEEEVAPIDVTGDQSPRSQDCMRFEPAEIEQQERERERERDNDPWATQEIKPIVHKWKKKESRKERADNVLANLTSKREILLDTEIDNARLHNRLLLLQVELAENKLREQHGIRLDEQFVVEEEIIKH